MTLQVPSRFNKYNVTDETELTPDLWNQVFSDMDARLRAIEEKGQTWDELIDEGVGVAIERINTSLEPAVNDIAELIVQANVYLQQLAQTTGGLSATLVATDSTHRFVTDTQIALINTIAQLTSTVAALQEQQVTAGDVAFVGNS